MNENDYLRAQRLTRVRAARQILGDIIKVEDDTEAETHAHHQVREAYALLDKAEQMLYAYLKLKP